MNKFVKKIDYYVDQYDLEKQVYKNGEAYLNRGWLEKKEFLEICLWKTRRPKKLYILNSEEEIKEITKLSFAAQDEEKKILYLLELKGVSIGVASAILAVVNPSEYAVMDAKSIKSLKKLKYISWEDITIAHWLEYIRIIREIRDQTKFSPKEIENALVAYNRINIDQEFRDLYM